MKRYLFVLPLIAATSLATLACSESDSTSNGTDKTADAGSTAPSVEELAPVATDYAKLVAKSYGDTLTATKSLQAAVDGFVAAPSAEKLEACKAAWIAARKLYGQTEGFRFYDGPIEEIEGRMNGWPLDEAFIDYTRASKEEALQSTGLVNNVGTLATITAEGIVAENENGGEKNLSAGWHAIEFLLWGQDFDAAGPGARSFTDFTDTPTDPAVTNGARRGAYLAAVTDQLVADLERVTSAWNLADAASYGSSFVKREPAALLSNVFQGITYLAGVELAGERMNNAYAGKDQEEEHSCFSDTTLNDLVGNLQSIENVYLGTFGDFSGQGLTVLVKARNPDLDAQIRADLAGAKTAIADIPAPFDQAILGADTEPGPAKIKTAIDAVTKLSESLAFAAQTVGATIDLNVE